MSKSITQWSQWAKGCSICCVSLEKIATCVYPKDVRPVECEVLLSLLLYCRFCYRCCRSHCHCHCHYRQCHRRQLWCSVVVVFIIGVIICKSGMMVNNFLPTIFCVCWNVLSEKINGIPAYLLNQLFFQLALISIVEVQVDKIYLSSNLMTLE